MKSLQYTLSHKSYSDYTYKILQIHTGAPYQFFSKDCLMGSIEKVDGKWQQTSGRQTLDSIVQEMGKFIDENS